MSEKRWQDRLGADDYRREQEAEDMFNKYARDVRKTKRSIRILVALLVAGGLFLLLWHFFA